MERITQDPAVMVGKPVIAGTRVTVESVLRRLARGDAPQDIVQDLHGVTLDDIRAAQAFAADTVSGLRTIAAE